jgi:serine/threonine protein kinase
MDWRAALECATGGELFNKVKASGRFDEDMARFFFQQLIQGVQYCHENGVAHRGAVFVPLLPCAHVAHTSQD